MQSNLHFEISEIKLFDIWRNAEFGRTADFLTPWDIDSRTFNFFFTSENVSTSPVLQGFKIVWLKLRISRALYS